MEPLASDRCTTTMWAAGESDAGVGLGDGGITPGLDLAGEDAGEGGGSEFQVGGVGDVVDGDNGADERGEVEGFGGEFGDLFVGEGDFRGGEIDGAGEEEADTLTGSVGLVLDFETGFSLYEFREPLSIGEVRGGGSSAFDDERTGRGLRIRAASATDD